MKKKEKIKSKADKVVKSNAKVNSKNYVSLGFKRRLFLQIVAVVLILLFYKSATLSKDETTVKWMPIIEKNLSKDIKLQTIYKGIDEIIKKANIDDLLDSKFYDGNNLSKDKIEVEENEDSIEAIK